MRDVGIIYCDCNTWGGVYTYSDTLIEAIRDRFELILLAHEPRTDADRRRLTALADKCAHCTILRNDKDEKIPLVHELEAVLSNYPRGWFIPNFREAPYAACIPSKKAGNKNIFIAHSDDLGYYRFAVRFQNTIDFFVCACQKTFDQLGTLLPVQRRKDIYLIRHGVPQIGAHEPGPRKRVSGPLRLIYHGRIEGVEKNVTALVDVAEGLHARGIAFKIDVVGTGSDETKLTEMFAASQARNAVQFHGYVPREDLPNLFAECDVAVLTSRREGLCLSLAEAMLYGLPGVAYKCDAIDYLVDGVNGYVVAQDDANAFADRIASLATNDRLYAEMSMAAHGKIAAEFSPDAFAMKYKEVLSRPPEITALRWPILRPRLRPDSRRSVSGILEWVGVNAFGWPGNLDPMH